MTGNLSYYSTGEELFSNGEAIYINKASEQREPHLHAHDFIEIAYVVSGQGIHCIGDKEYSVSKGDLFIINYDIPHQFCSLPGSSTSLMQVYNCIFKPEFLDYTLLNCRDFSDLSHHFLFRSLFPDEKDSGADIHFNAEDEGGIEDLYEKMYREYHMKGQGYLEMLRAYLIELLVTIFRACNKKQSEDFIDTRRREIIEKAMNFIKNNYSQDVKLEDLSLMAFISRNYFCSIFKECTGMTVLEYIQKIRTEEACRLLKQTGKKVIEIAGEVGYRDLKFFNEIFKRNTGKTPTEYRKGK